MHHNDHISVRIPKKEYHAEYSTICNWVRKYISEGKSTFVHMVHSRKPFAAPHLSRYLTEVERF